MPRMRSLLALLVAIVALVAAGCGSDAASDGDASPGTPAGTDAISGEITVSAAASLTEAFTDIGAAFEAAHPDTKVTFSFDSSSTLSRQILDGAPVDVLASADEENVAKVVDAGLAEGAPTAFARNQLVIVTKPGNPAGIASLADLADAGIIALCGEDVPCGTFAAQALEGADVAIDESSITRGQNAKATLAAVSEGDAVAGIVYVTDARAAGDAVDAVEIPADRNVMATYPLVVLSATADAALAEAFTAFVTSAEGQAALAERGFLPAP